MTRTSTGTNGDATLNASLLGSLRGSVQWGLDRMLSVGYGLVYDYIFERFVPYQRLQREILALVEAGAGGRAPSEVHVLDVGCGPGNVTFALAEAGFVTVGLEPYAPLVELAREKRRSRRLANVAFRQGDLASGASFRDGVFDDVVSVHTLYAHAQPLRLLAEAHRVLKPGGHAVLVNHTRQVGPWSTFRQIREHDGSAAALRALVWLLPNAIFETARRPIGPHYWDEDEFAAHVRDAGFVVLDVRRTFLNGASLLVWARRPAEG
ncbi:MAG TPA: methyltransferase domain-containing protein [Methylomirabilota bacterium]|nr:methyltransferase domain-containing protein [Methylomirabilota bacterium]